MAQYDEEELLKIAMQQYEENEEFKEKVNNAIQQKCIETIKKIILKIAKTISKCVAQSVIDNVLHRFTEWIGVSM
ncbi:hypothetical protein FACS189440_09760 [Bacteroidia bacterium]|nr:hypothetical protein FACS189423_00380 [Bacteroidia bacterium]GHT47858.1 hypothetical protein FACS189440_09760 [Bacteroidia bacterium]